MNEEIYKKYIEKMNKLNEKYIFSESCYDNEAYHADFDDLIIELIKELGYEKIAEGYDKASEYFWYA